jgi:hypothetical protein
MKAVDYFRQAQQDAAFRRQKIDDLRYLRNLSLGVLVLLSVVASVSTLYIGWEEGWKVAIEGAARLWFIGIVLFAWNYSRFNTSLAALEAMNPPESVAAAVELARLAPR